jgi:DNA-binding NarL/FixJ family response regulator
MEEQLGPASDMQGPKKRSGRPRVVVADDNAPMRQKVLALIEGHLEVIEVVCDGVELVRSVNERKPELAIVDITMPGMCGIDAVQKLVDSGSKVRVVFLTVHEDQDFARAAFASGAFGFVVKSQMAVDLLPAISSALEGRLFSSRFGSPAVFN